MEVDDPRFLASFEKLVSEESALLTDYGVRSLSKNDPYYRLGDNYWTSPIWMNINFLIIKSLHGYSLDESIEESLRVRIEATYK